MNREALIDHAQRAVARIQLDLGDMVTALNAGPHPALMFQAEGVNNSLTRARQLLAAFEKMDPKTKVTIAPIDAAILNWRMQSADQDTTEGP